MKCFRGDNSVAQVFKYIPCQEGIMGLRPGIAMLTTSLLTDELANCFQLDQTSREL